MHIRALVTALFTMSALAIAAPLCAQSELVIVKKGGKEYHRPGCELVRDGVGVTAMTRAQAESRKLKAHAACDPANEDEPGAAGKKSAKSDTVHVWVDGGKYYHKEKCERLGKGEKKMVLDEAGRKYWPCPACKPPIRKRPVKK
jgi:hypothetical protein